jgi:hypothetical protein
MKRTVNTVYVQGPAIAPAAETGVCAMGPGTRIPGHGGQVPQQQRPRLGAFDRFPSGI